MDLSNEELKAYQVNLFLKALPDPIASRLISDREFTARTGISVQSTLHLGPNLQITSDELVKAAKAIIAGETDIELKAKNKRKLRVKGELTNGSLILITGKSQGFEYEYIEVLSPDERRRASTIDRLIAENLISTPKAQFWRERVARELTPTELVDLLRDIQATPERLAERLHGLSKLSRDTMVPDDQDYWATLLPFPEDESFTDYVGTKLAAHQSAMFALNRPLACSRFGYTSISQSTLPPKQMASFNPDDVRLCLQKGDGFSLIFAFEAAAQNIEKGSEWESIGTQALSKLFDTPEALEKRCQLLAAGVIISSAGLARRAFWKKAPLYWRRLAALSHAAVLADMLAGMPKPEAFLTWASNHLSADYYWQALMDRREGPLWWSEAIEPGAIKARICARFINAMHAIDEGKWPAEWRTRVETLVEKFLSPTESVLMSFPGPFADFTEHQRNVEVSLFEKTIQALKELSYGIPGLMPFVHLPQLTQAELELLKDFVERSKLATETTSQMHLAELARIAHAAGVYRHIALADALCEKAVLIFLDPNPVSQEAAAVIIVDAANAFADEDASLAWLSKAFERMAVKASTPQQTQLLSNIIAHLTTTNPKCHVYLSSARATIDLKRSQQKPAAQRASG